MTAQLISNKGLCSTSYPGGAEMGLLVIGWIDMSHGAT